MKKLVLKIWKKSSLHVVFTCIMILILGHGTFAQNVGIGTDTPTHALSVNGSIVVDHDSSNYGALGDPSLLFGASGMTGISSNYNPLGVDYRALNFRTGGSKRMTILENGNIGVGMDNPIYKLDIAGSLHTSSSIYSGFHVYAPGNVTANQRVYADLGIRAGGGSFNNAYKFQFNNGDSYFGGEGTFTGSLTSEGNLVNQGNLFNYGYGQIGGNLTVAGTTYANGDMRVYDHMAVGGNVDDNYRLRVYDGNARIGGDFHATGNAAIGGAVDNNLRFRVWGGNSRFGGDVEVTGTLDVASIADNFTIKGTGSVRSNGPSPLRISFHSKSINMYADGGITEFVTASLPEFDAADEVRVMIAQFQPDPVAPGAYYEYLIFQPFEVNGTNNTVQIGVHNPHTNLDFTVKGTLYYTVIIKDL